MWHRRVICISILIILVIIVLIGTAASAVDAPEYEAYVVRENQTLATIATDYGLPAEYLAQFNQMAVADAVKPGQVLLVPVMTQLTPQQTAYAKEATASTANGDQIAGVLGTVSAVKAQIWSKPGSGLLLFDKVTRGTELLVTGQFSTYFMVLMSDGSTGYISKNTMALSQTRMLVDRPLVPAPQPAQVEGLGHQEIIDLALQYLGIPYKYGGSLPGSIDCSLLVQTVFARKGQRLPRTAAQQFTVGSAVTVSQLMAGDRLYFYDRSGNIGHTALYMGNGRFVHASSSRGCVAIDELTNPTYWKKYAGARR